MDKLIKKQELTEEAIERMRSYLKDYKAKHNELVVQFEREINGNANQSR